MCGWLYRDKVIDRNVSTESNSHVSNLSVSFVTGSSSSYTDHHKRTEKKGVPFKSGGFFPNFPFLYLNVVPVYLVCQLMILYGITGSHGYQYSLIQLLTPASK